MKEIIARLHVPASAAFETGGVVAMSLFMADDANLDEDIELLFCVHGGSYTRRYWNAEFPEFSGYSFADYMTSAGFVVATIDMLGMGESGPSSSPEDLDRTIIAEAATQALGIVVGRLMDGTWARARSVKTSGVGHSLGGMLVISQQAWQKPYDRLVILGWSNMPPAIEPHVRGQLAEAAAARPYLSPQSTRVRKLFYGDDVLEAVMLLDEANAVDTPSALLNDCFTEGLVGEAAAKVECPLFYSQATSDTGADPHRELAFYSASRDVTLFVIQSTAHCHNLSSQRYVLWQRIAAWVRSLPLD